MHQFVPYLSEQVIERDAAALLAEFERARNITVSAPVPIEDIVEKHLRLRVEFDDTHKMFGLPRECEADADILGAIFFDERRVVIDQSLDPEENPYREGRYRYTLAHEGGCHWRLHRHLFTTDPGQTSLFDGQAAPSVVCRSIQSKERIEWQADFYASCLLMPMHLIISAWQERFGNTRPRVVQGEKRLTLPAYANEEMAKMFRSVRYHVDDEMLNELVRPFAEQFLVSMVSMRIRLERIGLLQREVPRQSSLAAVF